MPQIWKRCPGRISFVLSGLCKIWSVWLCSYSIFILAQLYSQCCDTPPLSTGEIRRRACVNPQKQCAAHTHLPGSLCIPKNFLELGNLQTTEYKSFISAELRDSQRMWFYQMTQNWEHLFLSSTFTSSWLSKTGPVQLFFSYLANFLGMFSLM